MRTVPRDLRVQLQPYGLEVMPRILIITGEASGDLHGANLARALKARDPRVFLAGVGGMAMEAAGVRLVPEAGRVDIIGMVGPRVIAAVIRRFLVMRRLFRAEPWDAVVFIDNPGLNLRYAYFAKGAGLRVFYYIAPQIWAWRPGRIHWIKQRVDHVLVVLPFEKAIYDKAAVRCTFVGHPLLDAVTHTYDPTDLRARFGLSSGGRVIALLPGSRTREIESLLPILLEAAEKLVQREPGTQFILAQAPTIPDNLLQSALRRSPVPVTVVKGQASEVMAAADLVLVASGTATLQAAMVGTPMILLYRTSALTYWLARYLIRVRWIGLVNLVAGRSVVPELIQGDATGQRLYEEALRILEDRSAYDEMKRSLANVRAALGEPGASTRAAEVVLAACQA
jgi:lipid-A-disaccharide synthase